MEPNKLKVALKEGKTVYGSWLSLSSPSAAEIMAEAGHDFLLIDGEHSAATNETIQVMLMALKGSDCTPVVRVAWNDPVRIKQALDLGAPAILIPMVNSGEEALAAVRACRYPPAGIRGVAGARASHWGGELKDYLRNANDNTVIILQVEHPDAVENVDDIVGVDGIDVCYVGMADLAGFLGVAPDEADGNPVVEKALERVVVAAQKAGVPLGIHCGPADSAAMRAKQGFTFVAVGGDSRYVRAGARDTLKDLKRRVAEGR